MEGIPVDSVSVPGAHSLRLELFVLQSVLFGPLLHFEALLLPEAIRRACAVCDEMIETPIVGKLFLKRLRRCPATKLPGLDLLTNLVGFPGPLAEVIGMQLRLNFALKHAVSVFLVKPLVECPEVRESGLRRGGDAVGQPPRLLGRSLLPPRRQRHGTGTLKCDGEEVVKLCVSMDEKGGGSG